jgi:hypothetical protein
MPTEKDHPSQRKDHSAQRDEIKLYMEKGFQASFGYFAALLAVLALGNSSYTTDFAKYLNINAADILLIFVLVTNLFYLILLTSCLFAILKRGLFILSDHHAVEREWEVFARDPSTFKVWQDKNKIAWNIDNLFMVPVFLLIGIISVWAFVLGWQSTSVPVRWIAIFVAVLHLFPIWMLFSLSVLNSECQRVSREKQQRA